MISTIESRAAGSVASLSWTADLTAGKEETVHMGTI